MAENSDLKMSISLVWETQKPSEGTVRRSSSFRLMEHEWHLRMQMCKKSNTRFLVQVQLVQAAVHRPLKTRLVVYTSVLVKRTNKLINDHSTYHFHFAQQTGDVVYLECVSKENLKEWLSDDVWTVVCRLSCGEPLSLQVRNETTLLSSEQRILDVPGPPEDLVDLDSLSLDLNNLLEDTDFPDVTLQCGDRTFPAHRSVLAARSEVFAAMFRNNMVERETGVVEVADLDPDVLGLLLKYVYTGKSPVTSEDIVFDLYAAGDKYAVHPLKRACVNWIMKGLSEGNCCRYLILADLHVRDELKNAVVDFISSCHAVLQGEDWLKFSDEQPKLAVEVYRNVCKNIHLQE